jgi:uncharacterized membrane protein (UPF0136 family)
MSRKPIAFLLALALIGGSAALQPAAAQSPPADPDPWRFNVALYGWAINVSGNATIHNQTLDTNASTLDLLQKSDSLGGFMGYFEDDKGRAGLYADLVYTSLGFGADRVGYRNPIFGLRITTSASAALTYQMTIAEVGGVYELARWPGSEGSSTALDGVVGFRYWNNSLAANFDATANVNFSNLHLDRSFGLAVSGSSVVQWVDPVFGLRLRHRFTPNQEMFVRGDIGGFGLGSQFSWQAVAAYSYAWQFSGYQIAAVVGFRALGVNYTSGSGVDTVGIDEVFYGPIIGASFRF